MGEGREGNGGDGENGRGGIVQALTERKSFLIENLPRLGR